MSARPRSGHDLAMTEPSNNRTKRLYRVHEGRIVAGVCGGLAAYLGIDPTLVRLAFALVTVFGGAGILLYLCAWILIPEEGGDGAPSLRASSTSGVAHRLPPRRPPASTAAGRPTAEHELIARQHAGHRRPPRSPTAVNIE